MTRAPLPTPRAGVCPKCAVRLVKYPAWTSFQCWVCGWRAAEPQAPEAPAREPEKPKRRKSR
jgi:hypothetical protein